MKNYKIKYKEKYLLNNKMIIALIIALSTIAIALNGQNQEEPSLLGVRIPPSPNAGEITKYGKTPVSLSSGSISEKISLCNVESLDLNVPVSVNYYGSGIKTKQEASDVGLGWSLDAGGAITRTIYSKPDETPGLGYWDVVFDPEDPDDLLDAYLNGWDLEPDVYSYNFMGFSGKFIINKNGEIKFYSDTKIIFEYLGDNGFKVTDLNGNKYYFTDYEISVMQSDGTQFAYSAVSTWYLSKIESPSGDLIQFFYDVTSNYNILDIPTVNRYDPFNSVKCEEIDLCEASTTYSSPSAGIIQSKHLTQILTKTHKLILNYSSGREDRPEYKLDEIILKTKDDIFLKRFTFDYSYFDKFGNEYSKRLKLDKITEKGSNGDEMPPFKFDYINPDKLQAINGEGFDHWGYQNGFSGTAVSALPDIPYSMEDELNFNNANRKPDEMALNGMLEMIVYPTGLTKYFEYELHNINNGAVYEVDEVYLHCNSENGDCTDEEYFTIPQGKEYCIIQGYIVESTCQMNECNSYVEIKQISTGNIVYTETVVNITTATTIPLDAGDYSIKLYTSSGESCHVTLDYFKEIPATEENLPKVGGVRIKSITDQDGTRYYDYTDTETGLSSGVLMIRPFYAYNTTNVVNCTTEGYVICDHCYYKLYSSVSLASSISGNHIFYPIVKEIYEDGSYKVDRYSFMNDGSTPRVEPIVPGGSNEALRGQIKNSKTYTSSGDLKYEENYIYSSSILSKDTSYRVSSSVSYQCPYQPVNMEWYLHKSVIKQLTSKTTKYYFDSGNVEYTESYTYNDDYQITQKSTSGAGNRTTEYKYASDLGVAYMVDANMIGIPLETTINGGAGGGSKIEYTQKGDMILPKISHSAEYDGGLSWKLQNEVFYKNNDAFPDGIKRRNQIEEEGLAWGSGSKYGLLTQREYLEREWNYNYNDQRLMIYMIDNAGIESTFEYDGLQRLSSSTTNNGRVNNKYTYQYAGYSGGENKITNILSYPGSSTIADLTIKNIYDGYGRLRFSTKEAFTQDGNDYTQEKVYDEMGRVALDCDPGKGGCTSFEYEPSPLNRVIQIHPPGTDKVITKEYGTNTESIGGYAPNTLFLVRTTDENGIVSEQYTDIFGRKIQDVIDAGGLDLKTTYIYNDRDQVTQIIPPNGTAYTYTYFPDGLLKTKAIPDKGLYSYTYNDQDQIDTETLPNGHTLTYSYNSPYNDLLESVTMDDGTVLKSYTYNEVKGWQTGETLALLGESGTVSNTVSGFDDIGRIKTETKSYLNGNATNTYEYDGANNILYNEIQMTGPGDPVKITKTFEYNHGVRLIKTHGEFPTVGHISINDMHYNDNDWLNQKKINANQPIDYGYTARGWLNKINGLASTYPPDFEPCDSDEPVIDCEGPYTVTDISVLYNCIDLGLQQATNVVVILASTISTNTGSQTDSTTFIVPLNGGTQNMNIQYQNQMNASIPAGSNPQSTIDGVIQTIIDCLEDNDTGGGGNSSTGGPGLGSLIMQTQNEYALNNLSTMMLDALTGPGSGIGTGPGGGNTSTPPMIPATLFGMKMYYEQGNGELAASAQYNGNISWMEWRAAGEIKHQYGFDYDGANRLLYAKYKGINQETCEEMPEGAYDVNINGYDEMGNILGITRKGLTDIVDDVPQYGVIDNMTYSYNAGSNLLQSISEAGNNEHGFKNSTTYSYDGQGNMTGNGDNLAAITYSDYLDLPLKITAHDGYIEMVYDANGKKLRQRYYKGGGLYKEYLYQDGVEYKDGKLDAIYHEEGRIVYDGKIPNQLGQETMTYKEFYLKDHLGNTRVRFVDKNGDGLIQVDTTDEKINELTASYHYYPFGMMWEGGHYRKDPNNPPPTQGNFFAPQDVKNKYRYNGKEFIEDFDIGLYDYGARWYDPAVGRFLGVDPIAEKYAYVTTFNYAENEPVAHIDLWGLQKVDMIWNDPNLKGATKEQYERFRLHSTKPAVELLANLVFGLVGESVASTIIKGISTTKVGGAVLKGISKFGDDIVEGSKGLIKKAFGKGEEAIEITTRTTRTGKKGVRVVDKEGNIKDITNERVKEYEPAPKNPSGKPNQINYKKNPEKLPKNSEIIDGSKGKKRTPTEEELKILDES